MNFGVLNGLTSNQANTKVIEMIYTPLSSKTDEEIINMVVNSEEPSWAELELAMRLENALEHIDELTADYLENAAHEIEGAPV